VCLWRLRQLMKEGFNKRDSKGESLCVHGGVLLRLHPSRQQFQFINLFSQQLDSLVLVDYLLVQSCFYIEL
jgi:hypothetical protein